MPEEDLINTQIRDSVQFTNHTVMGHAASQSASMLDALMAETIGMAMYNAVNTQHNAQMIGNAAVAASCAKMLKVQAVPWLPQPVTPFNPAVASVTEAAGQTGTFTVAGSNFAPGLSALISQNGQLLTTISGSGITNISAQAFTMAATLKPGSYSIQVVNVDLGFSSPFAFTVPAAVNPAVTSVTEIAGQAGTFTVAGSGFAPGLSALIQNGPLVMAVSGPAITNVTAVSFTMAASLTPGTYTIQVANADKGFSAPYTFTVVSVQ
jgi:hypothetical protein